MTAIHHLVKVPTNVAQEYLNKHIVAQKMLAQDVRNEKLESPTIAVSIGVGKGLAVVDEARVTAINAKQAAIQDMLGTHANVDMDKLIDPDFDYVVWSQTRGGELVLPRNLDEAKKQKAEVIGQFTKASRNSCSVYENEARRALSSSISDKILKKAFANQDDLISLYESTNYNPSIIADMLNDGVISDYKPREETKEDKQVLKHTANSVRTQIIRNMASGVVPASQESLRRAQMAPEAVAVDVAGARKIYVCANGFTMMPAMDQKYVQRKKATAAYFDAHYGANSNFDENINTAVVSTLIDKTQSLSQTINEITKEQAEEKVLNEYTVGNIMSEFKANYGEKGEAFCAQILKLPFGGDMLALAYDLNFKDTKIDEKELANWENADTFKTAFIKQGVQSVDRLAMAAEKGMFNFYDDNAEKMTFGAGGDNNGEKMGKMLVKTSLMFENGTDLLPYLQGSTGIGRVIIRKTVAEVAAEVKPRFA